MDCLFCRSPGPFTDEHPIPESLGNKEYVLVDEVCRRCNEEFSRIEGHVLDKTPLGWFRVLFGIPTKNRKPPKIESTLPDKWTDQNDNGVVFGCDEKGNRRLQVHDIALTNEIMRRLAAGDNGGEFKFAMPAKQRVIIGRFFAKMALGMLCCQDSDEARSSRFDDLRAYARRGSVPERAWPVFLTMTGAISELVERVRRQRSLGQWSLENSGSQRWFMFEMGTSRWFICMTDRQLVDRNTIPSQWLPVTPVRI